MFSSLSNCSTEFWEKFISLAAIPHPERNYRRFNSLCNVSCNQFSNQAFFSSPVSNLTTLFSTHYNPPRTGRPHGNSISLRLSVSPPELRRLPAANQLRWQGSTPMISLRPARRPAGNLSHFFRHCPSSFSFDSYEPPERVETGRRMRLPMSSSFLDFQHRLLLRSETLSDASAVNTRFSFSSGSLTSFTLKAQKEVQLVRY